MPYNAYRRLYFIRRNREERGLKDTEKYVVELRDLTPMTLENLRAEGIEFRLELNDLWREEDLRALESFFSPDNPQAELVKKILSATLTQVIKAMQAAEFARSHGWA